MTSQPKQRDPLIDAVRDCQELMRRWRAAAEQCETFHRSLGAAVDSSAREQHDRDLLERDRLREQVRQMHQQIYILLLPDLLGIARGWANSVAGKELGADGDDPLHSLATTLYLEIMEALPQLNIDPNKNVRGLLLSVVRRRLVERYRKLRAAPPTLSLNYGAGAEGDDPLDLADPHGEDLQEQLLDIFERKDLAEAIWSYWHATCSDRDLRILQRYQHNPPPTFREIAEEFGPGWTEEAVRMRHHRIIKRTRVYLQERMQRDTEP